MSLNLNQYHKRIIRGLQTDENRLLFDANLDLWSLVDAEGDLKEMVMTEYVDELVKEGLLKAIKPKYIPEGVQGSKENILTDKATNLIEKSHQHHKHLESFPSDKEIPSIVIRVKARPPTDNLNNFMSDLADAGKLLYEGYGDLNKADKDIKDFFCGIMTVCRVTEIIGPDAFHEAMHGMENTLPGAENDAVSEQLSRLSDDFSVGDRLSSMLDDLLDKKT